MAMLPDRNRIRTAFLTSRRLLGRSVGYAVVIAVLPLTLTARTIDFVWVNKRELLVLTVVLSLLVTYGPLTATWVLPAEYGGPIDDVVSSSTSFVISAGASLLDSPRSDPADDQAPGASETTPTEPATTTAGSAEVLSRPELERLVHRNVNVRRAEHGLVNLTFDSELVEIARYHSEDMAQREYFSHDSPDGETLGDRYERFGYDCRVGIGGDRHYTGAENIAYTYFEEPLEGGRYHSTPEDVARGVVEQWMDSPGHRENILLSSWRNEGIGIYIVEVPQGTRVYVTQNFC